MHNYCITNNGLWNPYSYSAHMYMYIVDCYLQQVDNCALGRSGKLFLLTNSVQCVAYSPQVMAVYEIGDGSIDSAVLLLQVSLWHNYSQFQSITAIYHLSNELH